MGQYETMMLSPTLKKIKNVQWEMGDYGTKHRPSKDNVTHLASWAGPHTHLRPPLSSGWDPLEKRSSLPSMSGAALVFSKKRELAQESLED